MGVWELVYPPAVTTGLTATVAHTGTEPGSGHTAGGWTSGIADALSHFQGECFWQLAPGANNKPETMPEWLWSLEGSKGHL